MAGAILASFTIVPAPTVELHPEAVMARFVTHPQ
jgi:hypothetical protein